MNLRMATHGTHLGIRNVRKSFGAVEVLRGIDFVQSPGQFIALVGRSGSGKSTLLRLIAGLDTPSGGSIEANGTALREPNASTRIMFQEARLLPWKRVLENAALGLSRADQSRAQYALEQVGLGDRARDWPSILSGGQSQRVALARALASQPRLLLLDEPLGALDALTRLEMQALIERLWLEQQFTALLVTHDPEEAVALADRVLVMEDGRLINDVRIDLPRPRSRSASAFAAFKEEVLNSVLGSESVVCDRAVVHA